MIAPEPAGTTSGVFGQIHVLGITSPFAAAFAIPLTADPMAYGDAAAPPNSQLFPPSWLFWGAYMVTTLLINLGLFWAMIHLFRVRWRVAQ